MIKYIRPAKPDSTSGLVTEVYAQIKRDFGTIAEPFIIHSALPKLLAGVWMACRETELAGEVHRETKEAVAAAISFANNCPYCVDAHTIMLYALGQKETADAISKGNNNLIADAEMRRLVEWAQATAVPASITLRLPPFSRQQAPEIIGTAVFFHYINRMSTVLLSETPLPSNQHWLKSPLRQVATRMFAKTVCRPIEAGGSLKFLPKADLPNDLRWAKTAPNVAQAYACFASAVEEAGEYALPLTVRAFIQEEIDEWRGEASELKLAWSEDAISRLDEPLQAAADLALLTALSPHEVSKDVVLSFKKYYPDDAKLVGALSWASFAAARKIGTWIHSPHISEPSKNYRPLEQHIT